MCVHDEFSPICVQQEVWKYLLGVQQADRCKCFLVDICITLGIIINHKKAKELSMSKARKDDYQQMDKTDPDVAKRVRGEVSRLQRRVPMLDGRHYLARFENVIVAYLNTNRDAEYHPAMVSLCAPFIYVLDEEWDAYYCFEHVMQALGKCFESSYWNVALILYMIR